MFKKTPDNLAKEEASVPVQTIPADFYGGKSPVVKFKTVEKEVDMNRFKKEALTASEKASFDKATAPGSGSPLHPANLLTNRKFLLFGSAGIFVLALVGASIYYWYATKPIAPIVQAPAPKLIAEVSPAVVPTTTPEEAPAASTSTTSTEETPPSAFSLEAKPEFPSPFLADSADLDKDGLSDMAEDLFRTDPALPDTDGDGFSDGHELLYLYSPINKEPTRLIDSGLVKEYVNPTFGYKIYYPAVWAEGNIDKDFRDVLFSTITGENVEVRVFDKAPGQSFADWFAIWAPGEQYANLSPYASYFKDSGFKRNDDLVYYFEDSARIYLVVYHTVESNIVNYRSVIRMMAASFRLPSNTNTIVPVQAPAGENTEVPPTSSAAYAL